MARKHAALVDVLASIADGAPPNWSSLEETLDERDAGVLRELEILAAVARVHRSIPEEEPVERVVTRSLNRESQVLGLIEPSPSRSTSTSRQPQQPDGPRWGRLVLLSPLGNGVFGEVHRAWDPTLERDVALKLLRPRERLTEELESRVLHEGRTLAKVRHENVVTVFGADVHDGRIGLWMELVRGRTLERVLADQGPFGAREAAITGQDLCRAVAAVHHAGLVHRDIKANNVMREEGGRLVLMDFGTGKSLEEEGPDRPAGTPLCLAPEVLADGPATVRSDVYSIGVLLFHLVTRSYPVRASSLDDLKQAHAAGRVSRLHDHRADLPDAFVRVVERALAADPANRFGSAGELEAALAGVLGVVEALPQPIRDEGSTSRRRWLGLAALLAVSASLVAVTAFRLWPAPVPRADSIAVLPFRANGQDIEYFAEGVSDQISTNISQLSGLRVVSSSSARTFRNSEKPLDEIGRELGVRTLLAGSVSRSGDRLRVIAQLQDAVTLEQLWAQTFDGNSTDVFAFQTEISRQIAAALKGRLTPDDARVLETQKMDPKAHDLYLRGRFHWNRRTPEGIRRSIEFFGEAAAADPRSALPHAGLADAYLISPFYALMSARDAHTLAEASIARARELDPLLAEAHASAGLLAQGQWRWSESEDFFRRAIELNPNYASAHHWYAVLLSKQARFDEARLEAARAKLLDPFSPSVGSAAAYVEYVGRSFSKAVDFYRYVLDLSPSHVSAYVGLAETYTAMGSYAEAVEAIERAAEGNERLEDLTALKAYVYASAGDCKRALSLLATVKTPLTPEASAVEVAAAYAAAGDVGLAAMWLERAYERRDSLVGYVAVDPKFDGVRNAAAFQELLRKLALPLAGGKVQ